MERIQIKMNLKYLQQLSTSLGIKQHTKLKVYLNIDEDTISLINKRLSRSFHNK